MKCHNCGADILDRSEKCDYCGAYLMQQHPLPNQNMSGADSKKNVADVIKTLLKVVGVVIIAIVIANVIIFGIIFGSLWKTGSSYLEEQGSGYEVEVALND